MMEQSSNKVGCWARDKKTGALVFLSNLAPSQNYKPLVKSSNDIDPSSPPAKFTPHLLVHGPTNSLLYPQVVGTWQGTWCGLNLDTLTLSAISGVLSGTMKTHAYITNQEVTACRDLAPRFDGGPIQVSLANAGFDGQVLWFTVSAEGHTHDFQMQFSGNKLKRDGDQPGWDPVVYQRVQ
jgi:hypothetical protein